jgi:hypothetical protein
MPIQSKNPRRCCYRLGFAITPLGASPQLTLLVVAGSPQQIGGDLTLDRTGDGTRFELRFPAAATPEEQVIHHREDANKETSRAGSGI